VNVNAHAAPMSTWVKGPVITASDAAMSVQLVELDVHLAGTSTELKGLHRLGVDVEAVLGRGVHVQLVGASLLTRMTICSLTAAQLLVVGVTLLLMSTS